MAEPTNQIRMTLALQGQAQVSAGLKQTARDTDALGGSAAGIDADLKNVVDRLRALGEAAAISTQQLQRHRLEQAGLGTTADSAAQKLRRQQEETTRLGKASRDAGGEIGFMEAAIHGAIAGFGLFGALQVAGRIAEIGIEFDALRGRIDKVSESQQQSNQRFAFAKAESDRLGTSIIDTSDNYVDFLAATRSSGLSDGRRDNIFSALNEAGAAYNLTQTEINQNIEQAIKIAGKAKITLDDLGGSLGKTLPQTFDALALGLGVTRDQLGGLIKDGELAGNEVLPALADGFREALSTDVTTRITGAASDFARMKNEILLTADALSGPLTSSLESAAGSIANVLKLAREEPGRASLGALLVPRNGNPLLSIVANVRNFAAGAERRNEARDFVQANPFRPQLFDPNQAANEPFFSPGRPALDPLTGFGLLSFGQKAPTAADRRAEQRQTREADRELAKDQREQERTDKALTREHERDLQLDIRREEVMREREITARNEVALAAEHLRTGKELTGAAKDLFILQQQAADPANELLKAELGRLAALEAQLKTAKDQAKLVEKAETARDRADSGAAGFLRRREPSFQIDRGEIDSDPFGRIDRTRDSLQGREEQEYGRQQRLEREAQAAERAAGTENYQAAAEREEALAKAHSDRMLEIDRDYAQARVDIFTGVTSGIADLFGGLAEITEGFGRRGFQAAKAFSIAQALLNIPEAASSAYTSALKVPGIGFLLAPVAAATAVAIQLKRVAEIRRIQPGSRRFGGAVSAGQPYEFLEGGVSEEFKDARSGRRYFIPGNSGEITPARTANGNAGGASAVPKLTVIVNNSVSDQASVRQGRVQPDGNGGITFEMAVEAVNDNTNPLGRAVQARVGGKATGTFG